MDTELPVEDKTKGDDAGGGSSFTVSVQSNSTKRKEEEDCSEEADKVINNISKDITALYGIVAIISAVCLLPLSEYVEFFDGGFLRYTETAIFSVAIVFLLFAFGFLFRQPTSKIVCAPMEPPKTGSLEWFRLLTSPKLSVELDPGVCIRVPVRDHVTVTRQAINSGSFYLKVGCMIFAVGSMIYACILVGITIENSQCFDTVKRINPCLFIAFIILQLFFIFRNSQFTITKYRAIGRFGLMHLVVTNICICIRNIVDETLHEFHELSKNETNADTEHHSAKRESSTGTGAYVTSCTSDASIMTSVLNTATPVLYPCIIEYALISAGILFTMWRNIGLREEQEQPSLQSHKGKGAALQMRTVYRIDCDQAMMGLFAGLVVVVVTVVGLILFTLAIGDPVWNTVAVVAWHIMDLVLTGLGIVAVIYCYAQFVMKLRRVEVSSINGELDDSLLLIAVMGVYAYCVVTLMGANGGRPNDELDTKLSRASASMALIQTTLQTIFLFDASKRVPKTSMQISKAPKDKPAKQVLTFLLVLNFALWAVNVFCTLRTDGTPNQRDFYGEKQWTVMLHVAVPLVIFYRYHSTACIFEVWKRAYKDYKDLHES